VLLCVCVGVLVIRVLVFTVFCIVCTVFLYCFVYVYLFLFVLSVQLQGRNILDITQSKVRASPSNSAAVLFRSCYILGIGLMMATK
jgi:hypothetical protein